jgi:hypothetical protein
VRRLLALAGSLALAGVLAGCGGGGGGSSSSAKFSTDDLGDLVLKPSEAPKGLEYSTRDSGRGALEKANGEAALAPLRKFGLEGDQVSKFLSTGKSGGPVFAETIGLVFKNHDGASKALELSRQQASGGGRTKTIPANGLGDEAWGLHGTFFSANAPDTYFYTWRVDNALQSLILSGTVSEQQARAIADRLEKRAESV